MRVIKFRQPIFDKSGKFLYWHYWGFVEKGMFTGPDLSNATHEQAEKTSQTLTSLRDKNDVGIYEGDKLTDEYCMGTVIWQNGAFFLDCEGEIDFLGDVMLSAVRVIGNIFEGGKD